MSELTLIGVDDIIKCNQYVLMVYQPNREVIADREKIDGLLVEMFKKSEFGSDVYVSLEEKASYLLTRLLLEEPFQYENKATSMLAVSLFLRLNRKSLKVNRLNPLTFVELVNGILEDMLSFEEVVEIVQERCVRV